MESKNEEPIFYYTLHQKLWNILADNPGMDKYEVLTRYFTKEEREKFGVSLCAACEYNESFRCDRCVLACDNCPLDVSHVCKEYPIINKLDPTDTTCLHGLFLLWHIFNSISKGDDYYREHLCPIKNGERITYVCFHGILNMENACEDDIYELCSKYARAIANLKPKDGVKYI